MKVAVVGTRGFPGVRGGVERHCEELYPRLARLGVKVTVFARSGYTEGRYDFQGVNVESTWAPNVKGFEALAHTFLTIPRAAFRGFDLLHVHSIGPASFIPMSRTLGLSPVVLTVHALDYKQGKWGLLGRSYLRMGERLGVRGAKAVIAVSSETAEYLRTAYSKDIHLIPNGPATLERRAPGKILSELGLAGGDYLLFVGRLIPDKRVEDLIAAAQRTELRPRVVIVGDSSHTDDYVKKLRDLSDEQVIFAGYQYGEALEELYSNAAILVLPSSVEGLPMTLLEAMSLGVPVVASDIAGNAEALGSPPAGLLCPVGDVDALSAALTRLLTDKELGAELGARARRRVTDYYDWEAIASRTLRVYEAAVSGRAS